MILVKHKKGWCALPPGVKPDPDARTDSTLCGHVVMLRTGEGEGVPTCQDCVKALKKEPHVGSRVVVTHGSSALKIRPKQTGQITLLKEGRVDVEFDDAVIAFSTPSIGCIMTLHTERYKITVEVVT